MQTDADNILLEIDQISCHFGGLAALDHVSFQVRTGSICGLIGATAPAKPR